MSGLWLFNDRLTLGMQHCPMWQRGGLGFHDNRGRKPDEVFDITFFVGKVALCLTLWRIGRWHWLLKLLPASDCYFIKPIGASDQPVTDDEK